jgi:alpha-beta hydrolase superfamily lysophospholipase
MTGPRPVYLDTQPEQILGLFHAAEGTSGDGAAVLICAPWGWGEVASYRSRREWAERLAADGHPTLRFAFPATGDSAGSPRDPNRLDAWVGAIAGAGEWLRATTGRRVAVLGLGLGGLLAREAIARGARFEEMVLWGASASGRAFVRETRAFSRMQTWNASPASPERAGALPEGWIEAGGFVLSAETIDDLGGLDPAVGPETAPRRALLLERDGMKVDEGLRRSLEGAGTSVTEATGDGWAQMISHPEETRLPEKVGDSVAVWLGEGGEAPAPMEAAGAPRELDGLALKVDGRQVRESVLPLPQAFGRAFGVLSEPVEGETAPFCVLFLNAGAVRNIGPNRLWVETARRWAARGVRALRLDLEGIGEADGAPPGDVAGFYLPKFEEQLATALDQLEERGFGDRFLLVGLCAGGYWAFRETLEDRRVQTALLLNSGALVWHPDLVAQREARKVAKASDPRAWRKLLRGEVGLRRLLGLARSLLLQAGRSLRRLGRRLIGRKGVMTGLDAELDGLLASGATLTIAFSGKEPLKEELDASGMFERLDGWPNIELAALPGEDHTLRPVEAQAAAGELLDRELSRAIERAGDAGRAVV